MTIAPVELVLNLTYRCPLKCSHCCFSSDMAQNGHLDSATMLRVVDEAAHEGIERVNFIGGDPFLHADLMELGLRQARAHGMAGSATTSAYWATTPERARIVLEPLAGAGLGRIIVSYDDMHADFLKLKHVINAYRAARALGIEVQVAVVVAPDSRIDAAYMEDALGAGQDFGLTVYETAVNSTGRAAVSADEDSQAARRKARQVYRGPCLSALRHFSVTPEGRVLACCGVLPFREEMAVGDVSKAGLGDTIRRAYDDPILKWIAFEGPVALLCEITAGSEKPFSAEDFDGVCHACDVLYSSSELLRRLREYLPHKTATLDMMQTAFEAVGFYRSFDPSTTAAPCHDDD